MNILKELTKKDKLKHIFILGIPAAFVGAIFGAALGIGQFWGALLGALLVGILKEVIDTFGLFFQKRTGWSWMDIVATLLGAVLYLLTLHNLLYNFTGCLGTTDGFINSCL